MEIHKIINKLASIIFLSFLALQLFAQEQDSPMGKTWIIFIENSNYEFFASLEGPSHDV